jgi:hypothetical protein
MSVLRKFRKSIVQSSLKFDPEMYNNILGSLVITHYMLNKLDGNEPDVNAIKAKWKALVKKGKLDFWLDDKEFIPKALALFDMKPSYGKFAMCQSELNTLFLPYVNDTVLPIREDGIYPNTARNGKIYVIKEHEEGK